MYNNINIRLQKIFLILGLLICYSLSNAQVPAVCFGPDPSANPTLYYADPACPEFNADFSSSLVGLTNYLPINEGFAGNWTIDAGTTATASFATDPNNPGNLLDNGSTASIDVSSAGTLVITNNVQDLTMPGAPIIGTCTQSYTVSCYTADIGDNPDFAAPCPTEVLLIIDESGSINELGVTTTVENAVATLTSNLNSPDVQMALIEFESTARPVPVNGSAAFQVVDATYIAGINNYLTGNVNPLPTLGTGTDDPRDNNSYTPGADVDGFIGGTNWEDALTKAIPYNADIIIFITDGNPTFYNDPASIVSGEGDVLDMTALTKARDVANLIKASGSHLLFLGAGGSILTQPIIETTGPDPYALGDTEQQFCSGDYGITSFPDLTDCLVDIATQIMNKQDCICEDLAGAVFIDVNNDGCQDGAAEGPVPGVTVNLWECNAAGTPVTQTTATTTTDTDGTYAFGPTEPGSANFCLDPNITYTIQFVLPGDYESFSGDAPSACADPADSDDVDMTTGIAMCVDPSGDDDDLHIDAGVVPVCEDIAGAVFIDVNNNGCQDGTAEGPVPGVTVNLWECNAAGTPVTQTTATTTTGTDGTYAFGPTEPGSANFCLDPNTTYTIQFVLPGAFESFSGDAPSACADPAGSDDVDMTTGIAMCVDPSGDDDDLHIDAGVIPITQIPTMGEWGLICLSLLLLIFGIVTVQQKQTEISSLQ